MSTAMKTPPATREEAFVSLRHTLEWLGDDVHYIKPPVDPVLEMTAIAKAFDDSKALVADNIVGYPNARMIANLWGTKERCARLVGADSFKDIKFKLLDAVRNPIPPREVSAKDAPCQEVVIPASDIGRVVDILPMVLHTEGDGGRIFGSGVHYIGAPWVPGGGSQFSFYRMSFRGNSTTASINMVPGGQGDAICNRHRGARIPCTVNICPPPAIEMMGFSTFNPIVFPGFTDEIGTAGALQGSPVDIVKAKTVDAYSIAQSEWVLEGYIVDGQRVWETDEAEAAGKQGVAPLHPEWARFMGRAYRTPRAFELTAITHRGDKPIYYTPVLGSIWYQVPYVCASIYELCERMAPGFVQDVAVWTGLTIWGGVVIQVKKQRRSDEGLQRNIMGAIMTTHRGLRMCVVVDEDIDIWEPEDVMWAMESRVSPRKDIVIFGEYSRGQAYQPSEFKTGQISVSDGGVGIDATVPIDQKGHFLRARYPVEKMDFSKWFSPAEMKDLRSRQESYFRYLGLTGFA